MTYKPGLPIGAANALPTAIVETNVTFKPGLPVSDANPMPVKLVTTSVPFKPGLAVTEANPMPVAGAAGGGAGLTLSPATVPADTTGDVSKVSSTLSGTVTYAKLSGASAIAIAASTGVVSLNTGLSPLSAANFVVRAQNTAGDAIEKAFTITAAAAPTPTPSPKPGAPQITGTKGNGRNSIAYTDDNTSGFPILSHNAYFADNANAFGPPVNFGTASPYVDVTATNGIPRRYAISALNANGEGPLSNIVTLIAEAPTFAATYDNPRVAKWGSSRDRQSVGPSGSSGTNISKTFGGVMGWVEAKCPQIIYPIWPESNGVFQNSGTSGADGYTFASDGNDFNSMAGRRPKMLSTDADIILAAQTSNSVQLRNEDGSNFSAAAYIQKMTVTFAPVLAANKRILLEALWERSASNPNAPPQWKPGAAARGQVEGIVANGAIYAQNTPGVTFAEIRSDLVDLTTADHDPLPGITRDGDAHFSPIGSWLGSKKIVVEMRKLISGNGKPKGIDNYKIGSNLHPNPTLTGSVAISGVANVTGNVPTGITIARDANGGTATVVTVSIVSVNGQPRIRVTGETSAMSAGTFEGINFGLSVNPAAVAGKWYMGAGYSKPGVFDGWRNVGRLGIGSAGFSVAALTNINSGCTPLASLGSGSPMALPSEDMGELCAVTPFGKASANGTISFSHSVWWTKGTNSQTFTIDLYAPEIFETIDPHLFMYDENNTTPAAITNATTPTFPGDGISSPTLQLTSTQPGYWAVVSVANGGGADAALWTVTSAGIAKRSQSFDYATPNDADKDRVDQVTFQLTPFNTTMAPVRLLLNPTATYVDQGFRDNFVRSADEELSVSPNWTKRGTGTQRLIASSSLSRVNVTSGSGSISYYAPKQGDTCYQRASIRQAASASANSQTCVIAGKDDQNYVGMRLTTAGFVNVYARTNNVAGGAGSFALANDYTVSGAGNFTGQIIKDPTDNLDYIEVYQAGVLLGRAAYDMTNKQDWKESGFAHYFSSGNTGLMANFACVQSGPLVPKIGLRKLEATTKTGTAGQDYGSELTGRVQQDSDIAITYTGGVAGVDFFVDGQVLRGIAVPAGTYVLTLTETYPGAVWNGRTSQATVVIS